MNESMLTVFFLPSCVCVPQLAAERLVKYWDLRKVVFGEKAYLPMTLKGGCLSETDVENLKLGFFCLLPPDKYGRTVLYEARGHLDDTGLDYASLVSDFVRS